MITCTCIFCHISSYTVIFYFPLFSSCTFHMLYFPMIFIYCVFHILYFHIICHIHFCVIDTLFLVLVYLSYTFLFHILYLFIYFSCNVLCTFHILSYTVLCPFYILSYTMYFSYTVILYFPIFSSCTFNCILSSHTSVMLLISCHIFYTFHLHILVIFF